MEILPVSSRGVDRGFFTKRASFLSNSRQELKPLEGHTPVFILAMGAMENMGSNRNADAWPKSACVKKANDPKDKDHREIKIDAGLDEKAYTFAKFGKIYRDHKNTDESLSKGEIHSAFFNKPQGRVEVVAYLKNAEFEDDLEDLASGKNVPFSMSARVTYDACSHCGNIAKTAADYCECIKKHANSILSNGHQVVMVNNDPTFFDLSRVGRNADRIGYCLSQLKGKEGEKSASLDTFKIHCPEEVLLKVVSDEGVKQLDYLNKLSEIEKKIEAQALPVSEGLEHACDPQATSPLSDKVVIIMKELPPSSLFSELKKKKVVLDPDTFFKTFLSHSDDTLEEVISSVKEALPGAFSRIKEEDDLDDFISSGRYEADPSAIIPSYAKDILGELIPKLSLQGAPVKHRITISIAQGSKPKIKKKKKKASLKTYSNGLAKEYCKYQAHALRSMGASLDQMYLTVLSNYVE
jgi:hypothetical protein